MSIGYDHSQNLIDIGGGQVTVDIQSLIDSIREEEASERGILYESIADASGKEELGDPVYVGITCSLRLPSREVGTAWQLKFPDGNYIAKVAGGNLVGGIGGDPVAYSAGVQTILIQSAASTVVETGEGGSAPTAAQNAAAVWNAQTSLHTAAGSFGKFVQKLLSVGKFLGLK